MSEVRATDGSAADGPRAVDGFARAMVGALAARDKDAFMARVISVKGMTEILESTTAPDDAKARMIAETPDRIDRRRAEHAEYFDRLIDAGDAKGVRWDESSFVGVEVTRERADSGTMTRALAIRFDAGGTVYTMTAMQCISSVGGPIYLLSTLEEPISETAARATDVLMSVKTVYAVAMAYHAETDAFPADIRELADKGLGDFPVVDTWETELSMWSSSEEFQVCSAGPDTAHGTPDDICYPPAGAER
jgi:hypothetical protein